MIQMVCNPYARVDSDADSDADSARTHNATMDAAGRTGRQLAALWELTVHPAFVEARWDDALRVLTEAAANALEVTRVGAWSLEADGRTLVCDALYDRARGAHGRSDPISERDFPGYFAAVRAELAIAAEDAASDPRTAELRTAYLEPLGIGAMLDVAVRAGGQLIGILCHEHVGPPRRWEPDEIACATAFADRVARLGLERQRRRLERALFASEVRYRVFIEKSPVAIFRLELDVPVDTSWPLEQQLRAMAQHLRIAEGNAAAAAQMGLRHSELLGLRLMDQPNRDMQGTLELASRFVRGGYLLEGLERQRLVVGTPSQWMQMWLVGDIQDGHLMGAWGMQIDITDRKRAEEERDRLRRAIEHERDQLRAHRSSGEIIGASPPIRAAIEQVVAVAPTDATVLLLGESGVGKELFARAIHEHSSRARGPLVTVNCAAVPRELFESEFFGHVKGAFTGATAARVGRFQLAHGGTLFLDEVGEIPLELQGKLLRTLQERENLRIGDIRPELVNVRVVTATNRDLAEEVQAGRFRADLYFRLSAFPIRVPSLRERKQDLEAIARHLLRRLAGEMGLPPPRLAQEDVARLEAHDWPGNVRELENVLQRALILARGGRLALEQSLPPRVTLGAPTAAPPPHAEPSRKDIEAALDRHRGNVLRTAADLGLSRQALYRRMQALGVRRPS